MPKAEAVADNLPGAAKLKYMDLCGAFFLMSSLVLFILGFTHATIGGWNFIIFIAPLVIFIALFVASLIWEHFMPRGRSLLPHGIWQFLNIFPFIIQAFSVFM